MSFVRGDMLYETSTSGIVDSKGKVLEKATQSLADFAWEKQVSHRVHIPRVQKSWCWH